jgi:hypothetical protein
MSTQLGFLGEVPTAYVESYIENLVQYLVQHETYNIHMLENQWGILPRIFIEKPIHNYVVPVLLGIESRWWRDFPHAFIPAMRLTQLPVQWVTVLFTGGKVAGV